MAALLASGVLLAGGAAPAAAQQSFARSFAFPASLANGVSGNLVTPTGSTTTLSFGIGKVAVGELPIPVPLRVGDRGRRAVGREFLRLSDAGPRARVWLDGVTDVNGAVTNTGDRLMIDAVVSPSGAAGNPPPFAIPFDITNGSAFVDAPLPVTAQSDGPVRVQVLGVSVVDPDGQPFGVLGLELHPVPPTPVAAATPTPGGTPVVKGQCFVGSNCDGPSFPASQAKCCSLAVRPGVQFFPPTSWCPATQIDPSTGRCMDSACVPCGPTPSATLTPTAAACADSAGCSGVCSVACPDGTVVAGQCTGGAGGVCACSATCGAPTPCGVGQCFDTITRHCTGVSCGPDSHCPLPNQLCDLSGRRCPCAPVTPPRHSHLCCQCKQPAPACFDFEFDEVQPACPPGCEAFMGQDCVPGTNTCAPAAAHTP